MDVSTCVGPESSNASMSQMALSSTKYFCTRSTSSSWSTCNRLSKIITIQTYKKCTYAYAGDDHSRRRMVVLEVVHQHLAIDVVQVLQWAQLRQPQGVVPIGCRMNHVHQYGLLFRSHAECFQFEVDGAPRQAHLRFAQCRSQGNVRQQAGYRVDGSAVNAGGVNERVP